MFDRSGVWRRQITIPNSMSLLDAGADWVLVVVRDDLGVERVGVYEVGAERVGAICEHRSGSLERPKIPDVCSAIGVESMSLLDLIRREGWVFR